MGNEGLAELRITFPAYITRKLDKIYKTTVLIRAGTRVRQERCLGFKI